MRQEIHTYIPYSFNNVADVRYLQQFCSIEHYQMMGFWDNSGSSWTRCKQSAPCSRQITTPRHHSIFTCRVLFLTPSQQCQSTEHTHTDTHTRLTALFPGLPGWAGTRKVKPIWILLKQETVSGSGISWAALETFVIIALYKSTFTIPYHTICKSAPRSRQITMPATHNSVFYRLEKHWRKSLIIS